jgi:hypothetical protein
MKGLIFLGALSIIFFAASARAGDVSVDVSLGWDSHPEDSHHHHGYLPAPPAYYQWRSGNFYDQRFRASLHGRHRYGYFPYYSPWRPPYYRYHTPPTYYYYDYGYYGYGRPYYYRPSSGIRVWIEIGH